MEVKIFTARPDGMKCHWTLEAEEVNALWDQVSALFLYLDGNSFIPDNGFGQPMAKPAAVAAAPRQTTRGRSQQQEPDDLPFEDDEGDSNPLCPNCGGPTEYKTGTGARGPWAAYFCLKTKNAPQGKKHTPVWQ